jgi:nitrous oxide reductase accessory protein NosL
MRSLSTSSVGAAGRRLRVGRRQHAWGLIFSGLFLPLVLGCSSGEREAHDVGSQGATSLAGAEGAVCGMVVSEQPAPRAQVLHRDGTRLFFCGIGDLLVHLDAPSPHGAALEIYVEVMEVDEDPRDVHFGPHEWMRAQEATYRIGDGRPPLIMGAPVMVYRDPESAERAVSHGETTVLDFDALMAWWHQPSS